MSHVAPPPRKVVTQDTERDACSIYLEGIQLQLSIPDEVVHEVNRVLRNTFLGMGFVSHDVALLQQMTFIRLFEMRDKGTLLDGKRMAGYVATVGRNVAREKRKENKRRSSLFQALGETESSIPGREDDQPEHEILSREEQAERLKKLDRMLSQLPERQRLALQLYAVEDKSHREIAEKLGTSEGSSRLLVCRALRFLQTNFRPF